MMWPMLVKSDDNSKIHSHLSQSINFLLMLWHLLLNVKLLWVMCCLCRPPTNITANKHIYGAASIAINVLNQQCQRTCKVLPMQSMSTISNIGETYFIKLPIIYLHILPLSPLKPWERNDLRRKGEFFFHDEISTHHKMQKQLNITKTRFLLFIEVTQFPSFTLLIIGVILGCLDNLLFHSL